MNDNNETAWSVLWGLLICPTLLVALPLAFQEQGWAGGGPVLAALVFEVLMLALPSIWEDWKRNAPNRQRARAVSRERAAERARLQAERDEGRRQRQAEQVRQREEKAALARAKQETATARKEVESFYAQHVDLLREQIPEALFRANVQSHFPAGIPPEQAWAVSRDIIAQLQPLVIQAREQKKSQEQKRRERNEKTRALQGQIDTLRQRMIRVKSGPIDDPEFREEEVEKVNRRIEELEDQKRLLETSSE